MAQNRKIKEEIISLLIEHSRIIYNVISDMAVYYNVWAEDQEKSLDKKRNKMQILEEEADEIKIQIIQGYSEVGAGYADYIDLILKMDAVINYPLEFVDMLPNIELNQKIKKEVSKRYHKLINIIIQMTDVLKTTVKNLRDNKTAVFNNTTEIHELENEIDSIYRQFLEFLYSNEEIDIRSLLRLRDSIVLMEQLADRIHDIADLIRVLLYH
ncbi:MAG: DUF47 family protein [Candidatus Lokiarchaeota archaeon]|nr:DUF47 family protein [Candidatus Lokiarchaeota archaeon]